MFSVRWPLTRRLALWILDQALPEAPDLSAVLRTVFITMAAGSAVGVALIGLFAVGFAGLYQLMIEQGASGSTASLSITALALLLVYGGYRFIIGVIDSWADQRTSLKQEADIFSDIKDTATSLAFSFLDGLKEEPAPKKRKKNTTESEKAEVEDEIQVIHLKRTK